MSFANLPLFAALGGLAVLAALLFALQRLRARHIEVTVPTTLFWLAAVRDAPVRVFWQRFRHWLAYLLILLICSLLWLAWAGPELASRHAVDFHVLFLDGAAHTARASDRERAVAALKADLQTLPTDRREVIWGGAFNLKVLRAGEDALLLDQRLASLTPAEAPSALRDQLRLLGIDGAWPERVELVIYGRAPVAAETLAALRSGVRVTRGVDYPAAERGAGIVAFGVAPAASAHPERVDALLEVVPAPGRPPEATLRLDGAALPAERLTRLPAGPGRALFAVRDLPAAGGVLEANLVDERGVAVDDVARLRLPTRQVLPIALAPDLPAPVAKVVGDVVAADAGLTRADEAAAAVVVRRAGDDFGGARPALELTAAAAQTHAFVIDYVDDGAGEAQPLLRRRVAAIGLDQIDATRLANALQRPLSATVRPAPRRRVAVWEALFGATYNFTDSRAFPVFVARAFRYLAAEPIWHPYLAAGRPLPAPLGGAAWLGRPAPALDALGSEFAPPRAGAVGGGAQPGGAPWIAALLSEEVTTGHQGVALPAYSSPGGVGARDFAMWLALLALALLAGEWVLHQRGLIP